MEILVNGKVKELEIVDLKTGCNWEYDLLGNADAFDGYNDEREMPEMTIETYSWWSDYIKKEEDLQDRAKAIHDDLGDSDQEAFNKEMTDAVCNDYEMMQMSQIGVVECWEENLKKN